MAQVLPIHNLIEQYSVIYKCTIQRQKSWVNDDIKFVCQNCSGDLTTGEIHNVYTQKFGLINEAKSKC